MKPYLIIAIVLLVALVAACTEKLPDAMDYETHHQRLTASKSIKQTPYSQYTQFTQNNK